MRNRLNFWLCCVLFSLPFRALYAQNDVELAVWANEAIVATYTYDYRNYLTRQQEIAKYFTTEGWVAYSQALLKSKLLETVKKNDYVVSAVATEPPVITSVGDTSWRAEMPLLVVYKNPAFQQKQTLKVTINFIAAPAGQGIRGLSIKSFQGKVYKPACQCPTDAPSAKSTNKP